MTTLHSHLVFASFLKPGLPSEEWQHRQSELQSLPYHERNIFTTTAGWKLRSQLASSNLSVVQRIERFLLLSQKMQTHVMYKSFTHRQLEVFLAEEETLLEVAWDRLRLLLNKYRFLYVHTAVAPLFADGYNWAHPSLSQLLPFMQAIQNWPIQRRSVTQASRIWTCFVASMWQTRKDNQADVCRLLQLKREQEPCAGPARITSSSSCCVAHGVLHSIDLQEKEWAQRYVDAARAFEMQCDQTIIRLDQHQLSVDDLDAMLSMTWLRAHIGHCHSIVAAYLDWEQQLSFNIFPVGDELDPRRAFRVGDRLATGKLVVSITDFIPYMSFVRNCLTGQLTIKHHKHHKRRKRQDAKQHKRKRPKYEI